MPHELRLLVADEHGLLSLSSPDGRVWAGPEVEIADVEASTIRRAPDGAAYVGTRGSGLFRSRTGHGGWERLDVPPELHKIRSILPIPDRFLVGTEAEPGPLGVYKWDGARNWRPVGDVMTCPGADQWFYPVPTEGVHVRHLSAAPDKPGHIYAAVQVGGVAISLDNGKTWHDRHNLDLDVHMVEPHPAIPGVVYAATGGDGLYRSADYGESWQRVSEGCGNFVVQFAIDPRDPKRLYLGTGRGDVPDWRKGENGARGEMFRSDDGGNTWHKLAGGLPDQMRARINTVALDPEEPDNVFFGAGLIRYTNAQDGGVYHSPDGGASWQRILEGHEPADLCCLRL